MDKKELIVIFPRDCPNCASSAGAPGCDYVCPVCRAGFCSHCYKTDPKGDGTFVFCPHCTERLYFPAHPQCGPAFQDGDVCIFTNKGSSGITENDGKKCRVVRVKNQNEWVQPDVPEYAIVFLEEDRGFGVSEQELTRVHNSQERSKYETV